jgi:3-phosphoshikimate 1-carboxyvinyltransferase
VSLEKNTVLSPLIGEIHLPSDKSISHRAVMFASLAEGKSRIFASMLGRDNLATIRIMRQLGVRIDGRLEATSFVLSKEEGLGGFSLADDGVCELEVYGQGFQGLGAPDRPLNCGNSGTTARLLTGLLSGRPFTCTLVGDESLSKRPFGRVVEPLSLMGAQFSGDKLPLEIRGGSLRSISFLSTRASAQVKTALILAGLQAEGGVSLSEPTKSRDHSERMLRSMGAPLVCRELSDGKWQVEVEKGGPVPVRLSPLECQIPGDFSSAAFFLVAASIIPGSCVRLLDVGLNSSRIGLLHLLRRMGACISVSREHELSGEVVGELEVSAVELSATEVSPQEVVMSIDEIPVLCVAAAFAEGVTRISGARELRVKESDRLAMIAELLCDYGISVCEQDDGLTIEGRPEMASWRGLCPRGGSSSWRDCKDHRILMCAAILNYISQGLVGDLEREVIETSFPGFISLFQGLIGGIEPPSGPSSLMVSK